MELVEVILLGVNKGAPSYHRALSIAIESTVRRSTSGGRHIRPAPSAHGLARTTGKQHAVRDGLRRIAPLLARRVVPPLSYCA